MGWNGSYGQLPDQGIIKFFAGPYSVITIADRCRVREPKTFGAEPTLVISYNGSNHSHVWLEKLGWSDSHPFLFSWSWRNDM
jgi:hypothetical protein